MRKMIAIADYGMGNLASVKNAFEYIGAEPFVTSSPEEISRAAAVVLPGVGAFGDAMERLTRTGMGDAVRDAIAAGKPFLGICLGLQLLLESSEEGAEPGGPDIRGLGVIRGRVVRFRPATENGLPLKVPHMGWNRLNGIKGGALFDGLSADGTFVYFVHSYHAQVSDRSLVSATCGYGGEFDAAVSAGNMHAMQFHPEKSGGTGLRILRNFAEAVKC